MNRLRIALIAAVVVLAATMIGSPPTANADFLELPDPLQPFDVDQSFACLELVPNAIATVPVATTLDVLVLLDGVSQAEAEQAVADAQLAYSGIDSTILATYSAISFSGTDAAGLNEQAKAAVGGTRPDGVDVVYTLTSKNIGGGAAGDAAAGLADCIGGVRFDDRAFAVGEVLGDETGLIMAHEIGHLLGAHHHYASPEGLLGPRSNVLSLMSPTVDVASLRFSTASGLVVRGHIEAYG